MFIKIDKSRLSAEDLATYEAIIAKAKVDPEAAEEEMEDDKPTFPPKKAKKAEVDEWDDVPTKKSEQSPELVAALNRLETLEKSIAMKEFTEIAKKYAPLGEKEEELAKTLYAMKNANEDNYNAYIAVLDKSLALVEKSGLFAEIGKSRGAAPSGAEAKAHAEAMNIMKSDPTMTYDVALAKAWSEHPELMAEYDAEYDG